MTQGQSAGFLLWTPPLQAADAGWELSDALAPKLEPAEFTHGRGRIDVIDQAELLRRTEALDARREGQVAATHRSRNLVQGA